MITFLDSFQREQQNEAHDYSMMGGVGTRVSVRILGPLSINIIIIIRRKGYVFPFFRELLEFITVKGETLQLISSPLRNIQSRSEEEWEEDQEKRVKNGASLFSFRLDLNIFKK